jgi:hypothetical protein
LLLNKHQLIAEGMTETAILSAVDQASGGFSFHYGIPFRCLAQGGGRKTLDQVSKSPNEELLVATASLFL